jgi:hypothetical protein
MSDTTEGGFLGLSPEFARNLLTFGASTMAAANQRTPQGFLAYGSGALGPIGAGLMGMQQQGMDLAKLRSQIGAQQAQTANTQAQTRLLDASFPYAQQSIQNGINELNGGGTGGYSNGPYGFTGNISQGSSGGGNAIPTQQRESLTRAAVQGTDVPAEVLDALVSHESGWDPSRRGGVGEIGLGQVKPNTAHSPGYGVAGIDPNALHVPQNNLKFSAQYLQGIGNKYGMQPQDWNNPAKLAQVLHDYNGAASPPEYAQSILSKLHQAPSWAPAPYQVAQAGGGVPAAPGQAPLQLNMQGQGPAPGGMNQHALEMAQFYYNQAQHLPAMNVAGMGDLNAGKRAAALQQAKAWQDLALTGPTVTAKESAGLPFVAPKKAAEESETIRTDRFGNIYQGTQYLGRGSEVKPVFNSKTNQYEYGDVGGVGVGAIPPGMPGAPGAGTPGQASSPPLGQQQWMEAAPRVTANAVEHDKKIVEDDLAGVIDAAHPAMMSLRQMRELTPEAATGAGGEMRMQIRNAVQTFAPGLAKEMNWDASPAQQFQKLAVMGAGKQERGDQGARGGIRLLEMYMKANPSLVNQPDANNRMANALLVMHQYHVDYTNGATGYFNQNFDNFQSNPQGGYNVLSKYDNKFTSVMKPEVYTAAISALDGAPYEKWSNGLSANQQRLVGGIIQRADPTAQIMVKGVRAPVADMKQTLGPNDVMGFSQGGQ